MHSTLDDKTFGREGDINGREQGMCQGKVQWAEERKGTNDYPVFFYSTWLREKEGSLNLILCWSM